MRKPPPLRLENLTNQGRGRRKGSVNKATKTFRETVNALLAANTENVSLWLETVAYGDGDKVKPDPKGALELIAKLAEYVTPKLARTEILGDPKAPLKTIIEWQTSHE